MSRPPDEPGDDGPPVVPGTPERLAAALAGVPAPDAVLGAVPPLFGELTVRAVARYAVAAGCGPAELPVVVAAVRAALDPGFNLLGLATTTGWAHVGVLGHGVPAGPRVARAVALALAGLGGALPGVVDMSTHGPGAAVTVGAAEADGGAWPSLPSRRGLPGAAVTVVGVGGVVEVLPGEGYRSTEEVLAPAAAAVAGLALAAGDPRRGASTSSVLLVPPELAAFLAVRGWTAERCAAFVLDIGAAVLAAGAAAVASRVPLAADGAPGAAAVAGRPDEGLLVVESGGAGAKMLLLAGWTGGSVPVTAPVRPLDRT